MSKGGGYKRTFTAIAITLAAFVVNYMITLVLTPYITTTVGTESYGFVTLAKNTAHYATIATMLVTSFASRFIVVSLHRDELDEANMYYSSAFFGSAGIGIVVFFLALFAIVSLDKLLVIPADILWDVKLLFVLMFVKFLLSTLFSVYECGVYIANRMDITGVFKLISYLAEALVLYLMFRFFKPNVYYVGIGFIVSSLITCFSNLWVTKKYAGRLKVRLSQFNWRAIRDLASNGIWSTFNSLSNVLNSGLDLIITNLMLTPLQMGQLAIVQSIDLIFKTVTSTVTTPFQPILLRHYAKDDIKGVVDTMSFAMKITSLFINIGFAGFLALGMAYYRLWIPHEDYGFLYWLTVFTLTSNITSALIYPALYAFNLTLKKVIPCVITAISGVLNVISMYLLLSYTSLGLYAVTGTTVVLMTINNFICQPILAARVMKVKWTTFYPVMLRSLAACGVLCAALYGLSLLWTPHSWFSLILTAGLYAVIGALLHCAVVFSKEEWGTVFGKAKAFLKK